MMNTSQDVAQMLEDSVGKPVVRFINVTRDSNGKKIVVGERNNWTSEQIGADRGTGNTLSIYAPLIPELAVIDFDTKNLDGHPLWELCCQAVNAAT
jgi:hypothetical protein